MTFYAWSIKSAEHNDIQHVTTIAELQQHLVVLGLPGLAPPEWVTIDMEGSPHGVYTHGEGSMDEWTLTWTKVDGETEVID